MQQITEKFQALERKIKLLLMEQRALKEEVKTLKENKVDFEELLQRKDKQLLDFQNQYKISKIVGTIDQEGTDTFELKDKIDEYINEIDKCIAHLSK